jgi:hypothetical protein
MKIAMKFAALALLLGAAPVAAQTEHALATGVHFQGYSFDDSVGVSAANLLLVPLAYQVPLGNRLALDLYTAYARGSVERLNTVYNLEGVVDTRARASWTAAPWAVVMVGVNIPTGNATHDSEEAVVAGALSTNLLGFREASWGTGLAVTTGLATAHRLGSWGVGFGASYRMASEFEPRADTSLNYTPGNEALFRVALDRTVGSSAKLTAGFTFQNYSADQVDEQDLFQSGNRLRGDLTYSFRAGGLGVWSLYVADVWRERGDITLDVINSDGVAERDTTFQTGTQNLFIAGIGATLPISRTLTLRPSIDGRVQSREEPGGQGWLVNGGADLPLRFAGYDLVPTARVSYGRLEADSGNDYPFWGGELGATLRWRLR